MKTEKTQKFYIPSDVRETLGETFSKAFIEALNIQYVDSSILLAIQICLEEENQYSSEKIKKEREWIERRNHAIKALQRILKTGNFIKEEKETP